MGRKPKHPVRVFPDRRGALAAQFVAEYNQRIKLGRYLLIENGVAFSYQIPDAAVNLDTLRFMFSLLSSAYSVYPELARRTGALRFEDVMALEALSEDDSNDE